MVGERDTAKEYCIQMMALSKPATGAITHVPCSTHIFMKRWHDSIENVFDRIFCDKY